MGERGLEVGSLAVGCGRLVGGAVCGQLLAVSGAPLDCEGQLESGAQSGAAQGTGSTHLEGVVLGPPPPPGGKLVDQGRRRGWCEHLGVLGDNEGIGPRAEEVTVSSCALVL